MTKGIKRKIRRAQIRIQKEINDTASSGDLYARGLASEGYAGGYLAALSDVLLALNGSMPCVRPDYWRDNKFD